MASESDEELMRRVQRGDTVAFGTLLERHTRTVHAFIDRQTGGYDVDDCFQETWLKVARHAGSYDCGRRFSAWLFQIAVNVCRDWWRSPGRRLEPCAEPPEQAVRAHTAQVEAALDGRRLLAILTPEQREVLLLRYYHGMSEAEVAAVTGVPEGTVKSRLHAAVYRLRARAKEEGLR